MNELQKHYTNEQTGISYVLVGDYYLPNLVMSNEPNYKIGKFGLMRRSYLKNHRKGLFMNLLTSGKLNEHLYGIDQTSHERFELICQQMAVTEGVTEQLKSEKQMLWVQKMLNIHNRALEIICEELIYI